MFLLKFVCLWSLAKLSTAMFSSDDFNYSSQMDDDGKYWLYWNVNATHIEFGIKVETLGWIGLGFSPNGQMPDSDIVLAWIDDDSNNIYLEDRYASGHTLPEYDIIQSLTLIEGYQNDNYTYIRFIRSLYSCDDEYDDNDIEKGTSYVIYSWNDNDPTSSGEDISIEWHGDNRGSKTINLLAYDNYNDIELPDDAQYFDVIINNLSVPSNETTYWITLIELPLLNESHHIIKIEPIITDGNIGIVHHILLYECPPSLVNVSNIGLSMNNDDFIQLSISETSCKTSPAFAWAVGGDSFTFPPTVGLELSGQPITNDTFQYVLLEIHYNNEEQRSGYYDSSGLRLWYTSDLRENTAGLMGIGVIVDTNHFIPQGIDEVINYGYCTSDCTSVALNDTLHIFASLLHAHTAGVALRARHLNINGTELENIDVNWNYDFSYQQMVLLSNEIDFNPGDSIILECYYQTLNRTNITYGGESTKEEMCLVFFFVYPKPKLRTCVSSFTSDDIAVWNDGAIEKGYLTESPYYYNTNLQGAIDYYESLWSNYSTRIQVCANSEQGNFIDYIVDIPIIIEEYVDPYQCDDTNDTNYNITFSTSTSTSMPETTLLSTLDFTNEPTSILIPSTTTPITTLSTTTPIATPSTTVPLTTIPSTTVPSTTVPITTAPITTLSTTTPITTTLSTLVSTLISTLISAPMPTPMPTPVPTAKPTLETAEASNALYWSTLNINVVMMSILFTILHLL